MLNTRSLGSVNNMENKQYIGTIEVMQMLNIKTRITIYRWINSGKLLKPCIGKHKNYLWDKREVQAWKQQQALNGMIY